MDWLALTSGKLGKGVVFIDFGRNKVYALTDNCEAVMVFDSIMELAKKLWPIVLDSLPGRQQSAEAEMRILVKGPARAIVPDSLEDISPST